jgi:hypothetical protein
MIFVFLIKKIKGYRKILQEFLEKRIQYSLLYLKLDQVVRLEVLKSH